MSNLPLVQAVGLRKAEVQQRPEVQAPAVVPVQALTPAAQHRHRQRQRWWQPFSQTR